MCFVEALQVKYIGDKLSALLGQYIEFQALSQRQPLRRVAMLYHEEEGKWWNVAVCANTAWRSWGKRSGSGSRPGFDNWEVKATEDAALKWAIDKTQKQLKKGYEHSPGSLAQYDALCARFAPRAGNCFRDGGCSGQEGAAGIAPTGTVGGMATISAVGTATAFGATVPDVVTPHAASSDEAACCKGVGEDRI